MPDFEVVSLGQAQANSATGKRAQILQEYKQYIEGLSKGKAGKLQPVAGETTNALRRRLTAAATALGVQLTVRKVEDTIYFWAADRRRRRRTAA